MVVADYRIRPGRHVRTGQWARVVRDEESASSTLVDVRSLWRGSSGGFAVSKEIFFRGLRPNHATCNFEKHSWRSVAACKRIKDGQFFIMSECETCKCLRLSSATSKLSS